MPLYMAKKGENVSIERITGNDEIKQHLYNLGFVVGSELTVINELDGNLIVSVKDVRIAISREMAKRIFVKPQ